MEGEVRMPWEDWPEWQPFPGQGIKLVECPFCRALLFDGREVDHLFAAHPEKLG